MHIAYHAPNVARRVALAALTLSLLQVVDVRSERRVPHEPVRLVHRVDLASGRQLDVGVRQHKLARLRVESEDLHAAAQRQSEKGGRRVEAIARGDQVGSRLECVSEALLRDGRGDLAVVVRHLLVRVAAVDVRDHALLVGLKDAKDGSGGDARVDVGTAVKRVKHRSIPARLHQCLRAVVRQTGVVTQFYGRVLFLRGDHAHLAREAQRLLEHVIRHNIKRLLLLALHVD
mmetsp:Transcript_4769/g.10849  ORF Transcript_4769/g.10849 Transcript_4769/m.10849 type:complete len:231 (+) Transcript_4769:833-1525(+)